MIQRFFLTKQKGKLKSHLCSRNLLLFSSLSCVLIFIQKLRCEDNYRDDSQSEMLWRRKKPTTKSRCYINENNYIIFLDVGIVWLMKWMTVAFAPTRLLFAAAQPSTIDESLRRTRSRATTWQICFLLLFNYVKSFARLASFIWARVAGGVVEADF